MNKYFEMIYRCCEVLAEVQEPFPGIYYLDGGVGYAEFQTPSGTVGYYCDSMAEFRELCEVVNEDDGGFIEFFEECGLDSYEDYYTFDY